MRLLRNLTLGRSKEERIQNALPSDIIMVSGCMDEQTSADVSNTVGTFKVPNYVGPGGAGGACTNALLETLHARKQTPSYVELLQSMQHILRKKKFTQIPQVSASRKLDLHNKMKLVKEGGGKTKALLIGINYVGTKAELRGCHNDVEKMKNFIVAQGFDDSDSCMRILMDDGHHTPPTLANIMAAFEWMHTDVQPGDSLFFHYSGHGGSVKDDDGDEADGRDETLIPLDYEKAGQIRDDTIYKELLVPLPEGSQMFSVMDCCHSGTIFDLPYLFVASEGNLADPQHAQMKFNPQFNLEYVITVAKKAIELYQNFKSTERGASVLTLTTTIVKFALAQGGNPKVSVPAAVLVALFKFMK